MLLPSTDGTVTPLPHMRELRENFDPDDAATRPWLS